MSSLLVPTMLGRVRGRKGQRQLHLKKQKSFQVIWHIAANTFFHWRIFHWRNVELWWVAKSKMYSMISSVQFSRSVVSDTLQLHGLQHATPPCPSPTPGVYSNSYPLSQWCHLAISSSVVPFSCLQSFPASGSFPMSQLFSSGGPSISISPSNEYSGLISFGIRWLALLAIQGTLKSLLQHHSSKASILWCSAFFTVQLSHPLLEKP